MIKKTTIIFSSLLLIFTISCNKYKNFVNKDSDYYIIPKPVKTIQKEGRFVIKKDAVLGATTTLKNEANYLIQILSHFSGYNIAYNTNSKGNIILRIDTAIDNKEGYTLDISNDRVIISGGSASGIFYGIQSLKQLLSKDADSIVTIPATHIEDNPRFKYRGMHLDVGRHFFPVSFVKTYIDLIALHKMNYFHWHLTEDQGWRIEIKKYPKLTEVGGYRNGTIIGHYPGTSNNQKVYGGFYTQEEIKAVVKYAKERHIEIIPEIELPGHSSAAIAAYPFLSCFPDEATKINNHMISDKSNQLQKDGKIKKLVQESWGVYNDVFNPSEKTFKFLEDVLSEVIGLFPSKYIHIGGDECPKENWKRSKFCQSLIKKYKLKDEHGLQSYFIQRIEKFLNSKGRHIIGWDEILEGGLAPNATVMSWRGTQGGISAAKQNHNVIMTPGSHCYFDHYQAKPIEDEPIAIGGYLPLEKVYSYEPIPKELSKAESKYILGTQANVWTEYISTVEYAEYMIIPRMTALSEVSWSTKASKNWEDFKTRLYKFRSIYDDMGVNYAKHIFEK